MLVNWGGFFVAACVSCWGVLGAAAQVILSNLHANLVSDLDPQLTRTLSFSEPRIIHHSYHIFLSRYRAGASDVWNSGAVPSNNSPLIEYAGPLLLSHTRYFWTIQIETTAGPLTASSEFVTGTLSSTNSPTGWLIEQRDASDALERSFRSASWIWTSETAPPIAPSADRAFRRTYTPPSGKSASFADILITADNLFVLYVNGGLAGSTEGVTDIFSWHTAYRYHVSVGSGQSIFAVRGINLADIQSGADTPAGLLVAIQITHSDGSTVMLTSDNSWRSNKEIPANFQAASLDDSSWIQASVLGQYGVAPWNFDVVLPTVVTTSNIPPPTSLFTSAPPAATVTISSSPTTTTTSKTLIGNITSSIASVVGVTSPAFSGSTTTGHVSPGDQNSVSTQKSSPVGAIAGGVVGGVAVLGLLVLLLLYRKQLFRRERSPQAEDPVTEKPVANQSSVLQPFTLMFPGEHGAAMYSASTGHNTGLPPVRKGDSQPSRHHMYSGTGPEYYRDQDSSGSVGEDRSVGGYGNVVGNGGVDSTPIRGVLDSRIQRLQDLMGELNREIVAGGEGSPYVSELRGRISELTREGSVGGSMLIPPPYQSSYPLPASEIITLGNL